MSFDTMLLSTLFSLLLILSVGAVHPDEPPHTTPNPGQEQATPAIYQIRVHPQPQTPYPSAHSSLYAYQKPKSPQATPQLAITPVPLVIRGVPVTVPNDNSLQTPNAGTSNENYDGDDRECAKQTPAWIRRMRIQMGRDPCLLDSSNTVRRTTLPEEPSIEEALGSIDENDEKANRTSIRRQENVAWNWKNWKNNLLPGLEGSGGGGNSASDSRSASGSAYQSGGAALSQGGAGGQYPIPPYYNGASQQGQQGYSGGGGPTWDTAGHSLGGGVVPTQGAGGGVYPSGGGASFDGGSSPTVQVYVNEAWKSVYPSGNSLDAIDSWLDKSHGANFQPPPNLPASFNANPDQPSISALGGPASWPTAQEFKGYGYGDTSSNQVGSSVGWQQGQGSQTYVGPNPGQGGEGGYPVPTPSQSPVFGPTNPGPSSGGRLSAYQGSNSFGSSSAGTWQSNGNPNPSSYYGPSSDALYGTSSSGTSNTYYGGQQQQQNAASYYGNQGQKSVSAYPTNQGSSNFYGNNAGGATPSPTAAGGPASWPNINSLSSGSASSVGQSVGGSWNTGGNPNYGGQYQGGQQATPIPGNSWYRGGGTPVGTYEGQSYGQGQQPQSGVYPTQSGSYQGQGYQGQVPWYSQPNQGAGFPTVASTVNAPGQGQTGGGITYGGSQGVNYGGSQGVNYGGSQGVNYGGSQGVNYGGSQNTGQNWNSKGAPSWLGSPLRQKEAKLVDSLEES